MNQQVMAKELIESVRNDLQFINNNNKPVEIELTGEITAQQVDLTAHIMFSAIDINVESLIFTVGIKKGNLAIATEGGSMPLSTLALRNTYTSQREIETTDEISDLITSSAEGGLEAKATLKNESELSLGISAKGAHKKESGQKQATRTTITKPYVTCKCANGTKTIRKWSFVHDETQDFLSGVFSSQLCAIKKMGK